MGTPKKALVDFEARRTDVALFRHGLIARFLGTEVEPGELTRELRALARRRHEIPWSARTKVSLSSLRRWLDKYRKGGFEALKPGLRVDHGQSRAIPSEWLEKAMALRSEMPSRTSRCIVEILERLPGCPKINPHTLTRLLRRLNMTRKQLTKKTSRTKRWTAKNVNDIWHYAESPIMPTDPRGLVKPPIPTH
jgi:hypothetical protein